MNWKKAIRLSGFLAEWGRGRIKKVPPRCWAVYAKVRPYIPLTPVELVKEALPVYITDNGFSLLCIHTPESVEVKSINHHQQFNKVHERRFALVNDAVNVGLQLEPHLPVQIIDFTISAYWLKQQPGYVHAARNNNDGIMDDNGMPVLIEACQAKAIMLAAKLIDGIEEKKTDTVVLLPVTQLLIKDFLTAVSKEETDKTSSNIDLYYDKVKEAEAFLISHLQKCRRA